MSHPSQSSGKALPLVLVAVAVAALAFLYFTGVIGGDGYDADEAGSAGGGADLLSSDGDADKSAPTKRKEVSLGGLYGDGAFGAIRLRLIWVGGTGRPVAGQEVKLLSRQGKEVTVVPSDELGVVLFTQVRPAKGYSLRIRGTGFSEVHLRGITVHTESTKDLGDLILGKDIVLRGRVVDSQGRPVPGTSVSVHTIERRMASKGMLFTMAEQAGAVPFPLQAVQSDGEGNFAFGALDDGQYSLVARRGGYASDHETDVIVAHERGAGVLTLVLGTSARVTGKVSDADGKGIPNAQVVAIRDAGRMAMMRMNALQREVAITDEDGEYVLDTLAAEQRYRFGIIAKGYAPLYMMQAAQIPEAGEERNFTLEEGGSLEGVVTDEQTGKPIGDAKIAIFVGTMGFGGGSRNQNDMSSADKRQSDDQGVFKFESVTPGPVSSAVVRANGYASKTFSMWPPPGNMWPAIEAGQTAEVQVALKRGGTIRGFVRTSEDKIPIQGAEVTVMGTGMAAMGAFWSGTPSAMTASDGSYEITGVLPGKYSLHSMAAGFTADGGQAGAEIEIPESGGTIERDLGMTSAGAVVGIVVDPDGEPIAGVRMRLRRGRQQGGGGNRRGNWARNLLTGGRNPVDLTDDVGAFRLEGVSTDSMWVVYGESDEYVSGESKGFKVAAGETKELKIMMLPGGSLRGRVLDESGRVLPGARVQVGHLTEELLRQKNLSSWRARSALDPEVYITDEAGRFLATNLKAGPALVRASKDGYVTYFKRNLTIKPGEVVENYSVPLSKGEVVEGTVLGADGQPLNRAMVGVTTQSNPGADETENPDEEVSEDVEPMMFGRTDEQGKYKIENVKPGIYTVVVWFAAGHKSWRARGANAVPDEAAIHREVLVPAPPQDFKLNKSDPPTGGLGVGGGSR